jgi:hypothetical protein
MCPNVHLRCLYAEVIRDGHIRGTSSNCGVEAPGNISAEILVTDDSGPDL